MMTTADTGMTRHVARSLDSIEDWWRSAAVYQVYIRSFADGNGDGVGDLRGLIERIPYLASLGVDALWINPWYLSPMADGGYDVADYRRIDPSFGSIEEAEELIDVAHAAGLRVIIDIVPNHTSAEHEWFQEALSGVENMRARYIFRPGRGDGSIPPNDWVSAFGGSAWERERHEDGTLGDWYLHLYAVEQPDLDWTNEVVRAEFESILRFWFDRGVDGLRIDVAHGLVKADGLPNGGEIDPARQYTRPHPAWDQPGVHDIYRAWRAIADSYEPARVFVAEAWVHSSDQLALYLRADELHCGFEIDLLFTPWNAAAWRSVIDKSLATAGAVGAPSTWVLSNHDVPRVVTRYARSQPDHLVLPDWERRRWPTEEPSLEIGDRRARAAAMLVALLPGSLYIYQGDELGLPEVEQLPPEVRQDPTWWQSGYTEPGRDGCRVPLPWRPEGSSFGFGPDGAMAPWLPQPTDWSALSVGAQDSDKTSMLALYREALRVRRAVPAESPLVWTEATPELISFTRGDLLCVVNFGASAEPLPANTRVVLRSDARADGLDSVGPDEAVYVILESK